MNYQHLEYEGFGARVESVVRVLRKMIGNLEKVYSFLEDKAEEVEAYKGKLASSREYEYTENLCYAASFEDYDSVMEMFRYLRMKERKPVAPKDQK